MLAGTHPPEGPPVGSAIARAHGGSLERDPSFDIGMLATKRGYRVANAPVGVLFVASLCAAPRAS